MCTDCLIVRAKNFLIVSGAIAMVFLIIALLITISLLRRMRRTVGRVEKTLSYYQSLAHLPWKLLSQWLEEKKLYKGDFGKSGD